MVDARVSPKRAALRVQLNTPIDSSTDETLLHVCCRRGMTSVVKALLENGASSYVRDKWSCLPINMSVTFGHAHTTSALSKHHPRIRQAMRSMCVFVRIWLLSRARKLDPTVRFTHSAVETPLPSCVPSKSEHVPDIADEVDDVKVRAVQAMARAAAALEAAQKEY